MNYTVAEKILGIEGISLAFSGKPVLRNVEAEIHNIVRPGMQQGQVVCLLGPSGVGKTQFFRILAGLQPIATNQDTEVSISGKVLVGQEQKPVEAGMVGVVSQHYTLFPHRTVMGNLMIAGKQKGASAIETKEKAFNLLQKFGISDKSNAYPGELSGGQRQRVAIIQQIMCSSHFLLMDEPFSGLDPIAKNKHVTSSFPFQSSTSSIQALSLHMISKRLWLWLIPFG